jgi:hypothetical protein
MEVALGEEYAIAEHCTRTLVLDTFVVLLGVADQDLIEQFVIGDQASVLPADLDAGQGCGAGCRAEELQRITPDIQGVSDERLGVWHQRRFDGRHSSFLTSRRVVN